MYASINLAPLKDFERLKTKQHELYKMNSDINNKSNRTVELKYLK
jgi:hypothetical protein